MKNLSKDNLFLKLTSGAKFAFMAAALTLLAANAKAAQIVEVYPDTERMLVVSKSDINRLHFANDQVTKVYSNEGEFTYKNSEKNGDLYLRITGYKTNVSLFVETRHGYSYKLILTAKYIPSEQIILINPEITSSDKASKKDPYKQAIASLVVSALQGTPKLGYETRKFRSEPFKTEYSIEGLKMEQLDTIVPTKENLEGQYHVARYKVSNRTSEPLTLAEDKFFKPGVIAVSSLKNQLSAHESTDLVIVKGN